MLRPAGRALLKMRARRAAKESAPGIVGLLVATATFRSAQNMAQTTLSLLGRSLGLSGTAIGAVSAGSNLISVLTMLLLTARLAVSSARRAVMAGSVLLGLSLSLFVFASPVSLIVAASVLGAAGGLALPSLATAVGHRASSQFEPGAGAVPTRVGGLGTARALAIFGLVLSASLTVGPLLESAVLAASHQHLRAAYLSFLPIALLGALTVSKGSRPEVPKNNVRVSRRQSLQGLKALFANRRWSLAMCAQAIYSVPFSVVVVFGGLLGKSLYHLAPSGVEGAIAIFFTTSFLSRALLAWRPATPYRVRLFALCVAFTLVGLALLGGGRGVVVFVVALAILGVPHGLTYPLALGLVAEAVPREDLARANAGFTAVSGTINVVAPLVLGLVIDDLGGRTMLLVSAIPVLGLAAVLRRLKDAGAAIRVAVVTDSGPTSLTPPP